MGEECLKHRTMEGWAGQAPKGVTQGHTHSPGNGRDALAWTLLFYRPAGEPDLIIEEVDALFERMPRFTRDPPREKDSLAEHLVAFRYHNPISNAEFRFTFQSPPEDKDDEDVGDALTAEAPLRMEVDYLQPAATAQEAMPVAVEVCQHLCLQVLDPQSDTTVPGPPDVDALIRSYVGQNRDAQETLVVFEQRRRSYVKIGAALTALALLLWLLAIAVGR